MDSPQVPNSADQPQGFDTSEGSAKLSPAKTIALVAALTGFALVDLATHVSMASDQLSPEFDVTTAISARGPGNAPEIRLAPSVTGYYIPSQYANQSGSGGGNVVTAAEVQMAPY